MQVVIKRIKMTIAETTPYNFFELLLQIPIIVAIKKFGINLYDGLKRFNPYIDYTLMISERVVVMVASSQAVTKVGKRLEKPLGIVDSYACNGLTALETKYPSIHMAPEDFKEEALNQMTSFKGMSLQKLDQFKGTLSRQRKIGMDKAFHMLEGLLKSRLNIYVDVIDKTVDNYLPALEDGNYDNNKLDVIPEETGLMARLSYIPTKVQTRLVQRYNNLVLRVTFNEN
ncbi:uncharacterized protein LOC128963911 [Oppia nitens]|uniref:uncharacterized protein LOC128963911 n=1 Tax=Oppia nitens TaxID=1686743 RepID=UPI0023DAFF00|nr:uncharacterized protein LOC128963911 [Oppia nitens]